MSKKNFLDWLRAALITMLIVFLVVGVVWWALRAVAIGARKECERLGERLGYNTQGISGRCLIEVRPNLWVGEFELAEVLPLIDCEKGE